MSKASFEWRNIAENSFGWFGLFKLAIVYG